MSAGRIEAQVTFTTNQVMSVVITAIAGSPFTVTLVAGAYWPGTTLLSSLQTQLDAATGIDGAFTVSANLTDTTGTGFVTIAHATQTITITWTTATELRDTLGFTGTLTPAALTFTGTAHLRGTWLPDSPIDSEYGAASAPVETDRTTLVGNGGDISVTAYGVDRTPMSATRWSHITKPKALVAYETTSHASFDAWLRDTHGGTLSYFSPSPQVRVYHDSGGSLIGTYRLIWDGTFPGRRADSTWLYLWDIPMPPGYEV